MQLLHALPVFPIICKLSNKFFIFNRRSSIGKEGAAFFQSSMSPIKDIDDSLIQSREVTFNKTPILPPIGQLTFASIPSDTHAGRISPDHYTHQ